MSESSRLSETTVWYLEMASPEALVPRGGPGEIRRSGVPVGALNRFFYVEVGRDFRWIDRLAWTDAEWQAWAERTELWLVDDRGTPAGFAELEPRADGSVEIAYLGVLAAFRGHGLGGQLLTRVVERAWQLDAERVTVNTCSLDGPYARGHYEARGFSVVRETVELR
ncbi:MAG TPA: GNAT family N-acetyltransferase [Solirubrobacteraceae bacterium]|nr:GNAT family N-acetyltransferase [Solirubrobacteraceae bacterium]